MNEHLSIRVVLSRFKKKLLKSTFLLADRLFDTDHAIRYIHHLNGYNNSDYTFDKDQISFIHIPKTGGTSLAAMLAKAPGKDFVNLNIHRPISRHCPPSAFKYITVLRDPIARVWSYYQMVLREYPGYPYQKYAKRGLQSFLEKCWGARNFSCRYFSGEVYIEPDASTLSKALAHLDDFYRVILFDDFTEEVPKFLEMHHINFEEVLHARKARYQMPTTDEIALITEFNKWDVALYKAWKSKAN